MVSFRFAALVAATGVLAKTPAGFTPASQTDLIVDFGGVSALNGVVVSKGTTNSQPRIGTVSRLNGTSYAVMMVDLDIPTDSPPETNTLLHWMQTGLTPATTATQLNTSSGSARVFLLENKANVAAVTPYFGPNPPARVPLSHRYTQLLVDTSGLGESGAEALRTAAKTGRGFDVASVLSKAGLQGKLVAGNSFNVTNGGRAVAANGTATATGRGATGTAATRTSTATGRASQTAVRGAAGDGAKPGSAAFAAVALVGWVMAGL